MRHAMYFSEMPGLKAGLCHFIFRWRPICKRNGHVRKPEVQTMEFAKKYTGANCIRGFLDSVSSRGRPASGVAM